MNKNKQKDRTFELSIHFNLLFKDYNAILKYYGTKFKTTNNKKI